MADINDLDITRDQNDESLLVQKKLFQKNRYLLDDEANVIQDIALDRERRILSELVEGGNVRFGTGLTVQGSGSDNTVVVQLGGCAVHLDDHHAVLLWIDSNQSVAGWTTPSGSDRTDHLYIDISEEAFDSGDDANLINPAWGKETTWDMRLVWSLEKSEGSTPPAPSEGHKHISIARIERTNGVAVIQTADITDLLDDHFAIRSDALLRDGTHSLTGNLAVDAGVTIDGTDVSETLLQDGSRNLEGNLSVDAGVTIDGTDIDEELIRRDGTKSLTGNLPVNTDITIDGVDVSLYREVLYRQMLEAGFAPNDEAPVWDSSWANAFQQSVSTEKVKVRIAHFKHANINYIRAFAEVAVLGTPGSWTCSIRTIPATNTASSSATGWIDIGIDISSLSDGDYFVIEFVMNRSTGEDVYARKLGIDATFEWE